jgi:hypothetical protein
VQCSQSRSQPSLTRDTRPQLNMIPVYMKTGLLPLAKKQETVKLNNQIWHMTNQETNVGRSTQDHYGCVELTTSMYLHVHVYIHHMDL